MGIFRKRPIRYPLIVLTVLGVVAAILIMMWNVWIGIAYTLVYACVIYYTLRLESQTYLETEMHIESLSYRMKNVGEEAFLEMPFGIIILNDQKFIRVGFVLSVDLHHVNASREVGNGNN